MHLHWSWEKAAFSPRNPIDGTKGYHIPYIIDLMIETYYFKSRSKGIHYCMCFKAVITCTKITNFVHIWANGNKGFLEEKEEMPCENCSPEKYRKMP